MSVIKHDVVLIGKDAAGNQTVNMPITRLGNIESGAEIKEKPAAGDYIPIMDMEDGGQMKKFLYTPSEGSGGSESPSGESTHRFYQKDVTLTSNADYQIGLNVAADIYDITIDGVKHKAANGRVVLKSFKVKSGVTAAPSMLNSSDNSGAVAHSITLFFQFGNYVYQVIVGLTEITDNDIPFKVTHTEMSLMSAANNSGNFSYNYAYFNVSWPFFFVEGV